MYKRGTALLTTSTKPHNIRANLEISALPEDATREIWAAIKINIRFTSMIGTGLPGLLRGVIADLFSRRMAPPIEPRLFYTRQYHYISSLVIISLWLTAAARSDL